MRAAEYVYLTERLAILRRDDRGGVFHLRAKLKGRDGYVYRTTDKTDLEAAKSAALEIFYKLEALHDQGVAVGRDWHPSAAPALCGSGSGWLWSSPSEGKPRGRAHAAHTSHQT